MLTSRWALASSQRKLFSWHAVPSYRRRSSGNPCLPISSSWGGVGSKPYGPRDRNQGGAACWFATGIKHRCSGGGDMKRLTIGYWVFMLVVTPLVWLSIFLWPFDPWNGFQPRFFNWVYLSFFLFWVAFNGCYWVCFLASIVDSLKKRREERKSQKAMVELEQASSLIKRMEHALDEQERRETGRSGDSVSQGRA